MAGDSAHSNATMADAGLMPHVRQLGASLLDHVALRMELLSIEFQEEKARITRLVVGAALAVALMIVSLVLIAVAILTVYWDTSSRIAVAAALAVVFACLTAGAGAFAWVQFDRASALFMSSARELRRDAASLVEP